MRYETTAETLCKRRREQEQTELIKRHEQSCKIFGVNKIVPTHIILLSRDSAVFSPFICKSCYFCSQQHIQITRRHNFNFPPRRRPTGQSRAPCRLRGLSRDKLFPLDLIRLFSFTPHSTEKSSTVL